MHRHLLWDNHTYIAPFPGTPTIEELERHRRAGFTVAFVNLGDANRSFDHVVRMAAFCRRWLKERSDRFILLDCVEDIQRAKREEKLAIGFDIEGMFPIGSQVDAISLLYDLGVRWMSFVYNRRNLVGSGVHDPEDEGLSEFGREVAAEMDRVGMIKCLSHTGYRTAMDVLSLSQKPCIFSHSNALSLKAHARNIPDELIKACAATRGVVGINGISIFLGGRADPRRMAEHVDRVVQVAGIDHVGVGTDYGYLGSVELAETITDANYWPPGNEYESRIECIAPEQIASVGDCLRSKGYGEEDIAKVFGANMMRVASAVWH
jgi:membrane dipeptidase